MEEARLPAALAFALPRTESEIVAAAQQHGLSIPEVCMLGVVINLALLASHADCLLGGNHTS